MLWPKPLVLALFFVIIVAACANVPLPPVGTATHPEVREEFLLMNPDGRFNQFVSKGEVVTGMGFEEVLASWGLPESRRLSRDRKQEYWTYLGEDDLSGDWMRYTFVFEKRLLVDWDVSRHFIKNGTLINWDTPGTDPLPEPERRGGLTAKR